MIFHNQNLMSLNKKILGVILNFDLTFEEHISTKIKETNVLVDLVQINFRYLQGTLLKFFLSLAPMES